MGKSAWVVRRASAFVFRSKDQRLNSPSRSERKYTVSPTHIGAASFARPAGCGIFSTAFERTSKIQICETEPPRYRFHCRYCGPVGL